MWVNEINNGLVFLNAMWMVLSVAGALFFVFFGLAKISSRRPILSVVIVVLFVGSVVSGFLSVDYHLNKSGVTENQKNLENWVTESYGIELSSQGRDILYSSIGSTDIFLVVELGGEKVSVKLAPFGEQNNSYVLVNAKTLVPVPTADSNIEGTW